MQKIIIAGFPGVGKTYASEKLPNIVIDMESSNFHWIITPDGKKVAHPEWPANYVKAIKAIAYETEGLEDYRGTMYILISTHKDVLNALVSEEIPFIITAPPHIEKKKYLDRYEKRGNNEAFIENMDKNWDSYFDDINSYGVPIQFLGGITLFDIVDRVSSYLYLSSKIQDLETYGYRHDKE